VRISVENLDKVISHLKDYKKDLRVKVKLFLERLSVLGAYRARVEFTIAMYAGKNDVTISVTSTRKGYKVVAKGQAVLFIEFGTGVINPEHPRSDEFGFSHGTYGKGKGANEKGWVYVGEQGNAGQPIREGVYRTYGNPPAKAMYYAAKDMKAQIYTIAKEVFG
jgi:hypothetical protein